MDPTVRLATPADAEAVARLLHDFNTEFDTPSPGVETLAPRLAQLLGGDDTVAVLAGDPGAEVAVGLVTLRSNVWYEGRVALLDELYVVPTLRSQGIGSRVIDLVVSTCRDRGAELLEVNVDEPDVDAQRFYERHGISGIEPDTG